MKPRTYFLLALSTSSFLLSCNQTTTDKAILSMSDIESPLIMEFKTSDSLTNIALAKIKDRLKEKNQPIDSLFISRIEYDSAQNVIFFDITHFNSFLLRRKFETEDSLNIDDYITIPPTGNWSGYDRTMIYHIYNNELDDLLHQ